MAMTFGEKIREARKAKKMTQKDLAKRMGLAHNSISDYENNKSTPDPDQIELLCGILDLTPSYLLETSSEDFSPSEKLLVKQYRSLSPYDKETVNVLIDRLCERADSNIVEFPRRHIPYYDAVVSAGTGELVFNDVPSELIAIPDTTETKNAAFAVRVKGDSMEPTFYDGDRVMVQKTPSINVGDIGIFIDPDSNEGFIKELGKDCLVSHNKNYPDMIPNKHIRILGKVLGKIDE